jgi:ankyrin repeat protein
MVNSDTINNSENEITEVKDLYDKSNMTNLISKQSCIDKKYNCNYQKTYSKIELYNINPSTNRPYTEEERKNKVNEYKNICDNHKKSSLRICCDKNDPRLNALMNSSHPVIKQSFNKMRLVYPYIKNNISNGDIESISVCRDDDDKCKVKGYKKPDGYELCKLLKNETIKDVNYQDINNENLSDNCTMFNCKNSSINSSSNSHLDDVIIFNSIKIDDVKELRKLLINNPKLISVNMKYPNNNPIIHETIINNSMKSFRLILGFSNRITILDDYGNTPLHLSCLIGREVMTYMLIKQGSELFSKNKYGDTPLHCAAMSGSEKVIYLLLNSDVSIHALNNNGENPLFSAIKCKKKNLNIIKLLVDKGSDINLRNKNGESMINVLQKEEKNLLNDQIQTFLKKKYFDRCKSQNEYELLLKENPEISIYEFEGINDENVEVEVEYNEDNNQDKYYYNKEFPIKKNLIETFTVSQHSDFRTKLMFVIGFIIIILLKIYNQ